MISAQSSSANVSKSKSASGIASIHILQRIEDSLLGAVIGALALGFILVGLVWIAGALS